MATEITKQEDRVNMSTVFAAASTSATASASTTTTTTWPVLTQPVSNDAPKRLTREGVAILEDFALEHGVSYNPTNKEAARLAQKIKDETRYEAMDAAKVKQWFARRRREIKEKHQEAQQRSHAAAQPSASSYSSRPKPPTSNVGTSVSQAFGNFGQWLAPKLSQAQIATLEVMRNKDGFIDDALIKTLADSWSLPKNVLDNYLHEHPPKTRDPLTPVSPTIPQRQPGGGAATVFVDHRLPTPADSVASPSMSYAGDAFAYADEPQVDVLPAKPSLAPSPYSSITAPPANPDDMVVDSVPEVTPTKTLLPTEVLFQAILEGVRGVPDTQSPTAARPSNAAEFGALWPSLPCLEEVLSQIF